MHPGAASPPAVMRARRARKLTSSLRAGPEPAPNAALTERLPAGPSVVVMTERASAAHLLRRLTFGPTAAEVDAAERAGLAATLTDLLAPIGATVRLPAIGPDPLAGLGRDTS